MMKGLLPLALFALICFLDTAHQEIVETAENVINSKWEYTREELQILDEALTQLEQSDLPLLHSFEVVAILQKAADIVDVHPSQGDLNTFMDNASAKESQHYYKTFREKLNLIMQQYVPYRNAQVYSTSKHALQQNKNIGGIGVIMGKANFKGTIIDDTFRLNRRNSALGKLNAVKNLVEVFDNNFLPGIHNVEGHLICTTNFARRANITNTYLEEAGEGKHRLLADLHIGNNGEEAVEVKGVDLAVSAPLLSDPQDFNGVIICGTMSRFAQLVEITPTELPDFVMGPWKVNVKLLSVHVIQTDTQSAVTHFQALVNVLDNVNVTTSGSRTFAYFGSANNPNWSVHSLKESINEEQQCVLHRGLSRDQEQQVFLDCKFGRRGMLSKGIKFGSALLSRTYGIFSLFSFLNAAAASRAIEQTKSEQSQCFQYYREFEKIRHESGMKKFFSLFILSVGTLLFGKIINSALRNYKLSQRHAETMKAVASNKLSAVYIIMSEGE